MIENNIAFNVLNSQSFHDFINALNSKYKVPSPWSASHKIMDSVFNEHQQQIQQKLDETPFLAIATDSWSNEHQQTIVNIVACCRKPILLRSIHVDGSLTGVVYADLIKETIDMYGIRDKVVQIITTVQLSPEQVIRGKQEFLSFVDKTGDFDFVDYKKDPLVFWEGFKDLVIGQVALRVFHMITSSAAVERTFSMQKRFRGTLRNKLSQELTVKMVKIVFSDMDEAPRKKQRSTSLRRPLLSAADNVGDAEDNNNENTALSADDERELILCLLSLAERDEDLSYEQDMRLIAAPEKKPSAELDDTNNDSDSDDSVKVLKDPGHRDTSIEVVTETPADVMSSLIWTSTTSSMKKQKQAVVRVNGLKPATMWHK